MEINKYKKTKTIINKYKKTSHSTRKHVLNHVSLSIILFVIKVRTFMSESNGKFKERGTCLPYG